MVINLCLPQFRPQIHCNKISADGYEVENLISEDLVKRNRGFRCEYFIRPPVHVTITFPFNIDIGRIRIDTTAGGHQQFTGLDIYTSTSLNKISLNSQQSKFTNELSQPFSDKDVFVLVGKVLLKNQSKAIFHHRSFKARPPFLQAEPPVSYPGSVSYDLWNKGPFSLSNVTHLKICITHIVGGGLPCVKRIEVWGQPAKSCPQEVIARVQQIASECLLQPFGFPVLASQMESNCMSNSHSDIAPPSLQDLDIRDVPEEFLDPITLEIMTLPMLLPSGKVIDQSTLEKCNRSEASWGRMPSDPFTGVTYSHHSQPVPHPSLKVRIDYFLLQHSVPGSSILGRAQAAGMVAPSTLTVPSLKRKVGCMEQSSNSSIHLEPFFFATTNCVVTSTSENCPKKMKTDEIGASQMDCSAVPVCHEQRLSQSLDMALSSALSSMPSFTTKLPKGPQQLASDGDLSSSSSSWNISNVSDHNTSITEHGCSSCSRTFSAYFKTEPVYQLPCGHLMCRPCLAEKQKSFAILCMNCKRSVAARDILRVHL